jgi:hypothetical protein
VSFFEWGWCLVMSGSILLKGCIKHGGKCNQTGNSGSSGHNSRCSRVINMLNYSEVSCNESGGPLAAILAVSR